MVYTENIGFDWDDRKAESNFKKHGITFEEAAFALTDLHGYFEEDIKHSTPSELRMKVTVELFTNVLILVAITIRNDKIRIISARRVNEKEKKKYRENRLFGHSRNY